MACLPTVCAEPRLVPTLAFLEGERPPRPTSAIQFHGDMLEGEGGAVEKGKGGGEGTDWKEGGLEENGEGKEGEGAGTGIGRCWQQPGFVRWRWQPPRIPGNW